MIDSIEGKSQGDRVVSTKIPREIFTRFQHYCEVSGETMNASLKRLIMSEIDTPKPVRIAAKSVFEYNRDKDNYAWKVVMDNGSIFDIDLNLPSISTEQLLESLIKATEERKAFLRKHNKDSVPFPTTILSKKT